MRFQPSAHSAPSWGDPAVEQTDKEKKAARRKKRQAARKKRRREALLRKEERNVWLIPLIAGGSILLLGGAGLALSGRGKRRQIAPKQ